jgi:hypothetical protein
MERHREGKLRARENDCVKAIEHKAGLRRSNDEKLAHAADMESGDAAHCATLRSVGRTRMVTLRWRKVRGVAHSIQFDPAERLPGRADKFGRLIVELAGAGVALAGKNADIGGALR